MPISVLPPSFLPNSCYFCHFYNVEHAVFIINSCVYFHFTSTVKPIQCPPKCLYHSSSIISLLEEVCPLLVSSRRAHGKHHLWVLLCSKLYVYVCVLTALFLEEYKIFTLPFASLSFFLMLFHPLLVLKMSTWRNLKPTVFLPLSEVNLSFFYFGPQRFLYLNSKNL